MHFTVRVKMCEIGESEGAGVGERGGRAWPGIEMVAANLGITRKLGGPRVRI